MAESSGKSTKANHPGVRKIVKLYEKRNPNDLMWFQAVGQILKEAEHGDVGPFRKRFIRATAEQLPGPLGIETRVNELTSARRFAAHYPSESAVKKLMARASSEGMTLGITHMTLLGSIDDPKRRGEFLDRCLKEKWGTTRLRAEIKRHRHERKTKGRPFRAPASRIEGLQNLIEQCDEWLRRCTTVWFAGARPLIENPDRSEKPKVVEKLLRDAHRLLRQMAEEIELAMRKLATAEGQAKKRQATASKAKPAKSTTLEALETLTSEQWPI